MCEYGHPMINNLVMDNYLNIIKHPKTTKNIMKENKPVFHTFLL